MCTSSIVLLLAVTLAACGSGSSTDAPNDALAAPTDAPIAPQADATSAHHLCSNEAPDHVKPPVSQLDAMPVHLPVRVGPAFEVKEAITPSSDAVVTPPAPPASLLAAQAEMDRADTMLRARLGHDVEAYAEARAKLKAETIGQAR